MKTEMMVWQWHQLDHMQIICCSVLTADRLPCQQLVTQFFTGRIPYLHPTNSVKALKATRKEDKVVRCEW